MSKLYRVLLKDDDYNSYLDFSFAENAADATNIVVKKAIEQDAFHGKSADNMRVRPASLKNRDGLTYSKDEIVDEIKNGNISDDNAQIIAMALQYLYLVY